MNHKPYGIYERSIKRVIDIVVSLLVIILLSWLYLIVALLVRINLGSPVIFKQKRPGKNEKIFNMYKFRTMTDARDESGNLLPDEERITKFGLWLRRTSLDELPEIFCILFGTMSLIGPRPLLVKYLPYYTDEERLRHAVRPGLTGNAQAHGRNTISWEDKFRLDVEYVNHITLWTDIKVIIDTVKAVFAHSDIELNALPDLDEYRISQGFETKEK